MRLNVRGAGEDIDWNVRDARSLKAVGPEVSS